MFACAEVGEEGGEHFFLGGWVCGVCDVVCSSFFGAIRFCWGLSGLGKGKVGGGRVGVEMGGDGVHNGRGWRALFCIVALLE